MISFSLSPSTIVFSLSGSSLSQPQVGCYGTCVLEHVLVDTSDHYSCSGNAKIGYSPLQIGGDPEDLSFLFFSVLSLIGTINYNIGEKLYHSYLCRQVCESIYTLSIYTYKTQNPHTHSPALYKQKEISTKDFSRSITPQSKSIRAPSTRRQYLFKKR